ncbi:MAG: BACON domain-containing protein [Prevotella sp.]
MNTINDGFMLLLDEVSFGGKVIGLISADGITWGGDDPEVFSLMAAQLRNGPAKQIATSPGTDEFSFQMIQLLAENMQDILGGDINGESFQAPDMIETKEGILVIKTGTGQTITVPKVSLYGKVRGQLGGTNNLYINTTATILGQKDVSPYSIAPTAPAVMVSESDLVFPADGGVQVVRISASGTVSLSAAPAGFSLAQDGNYLVVTAAANAGLEKTGTITVTLVSDKTKTATINITQAAGS